MCCFGRLALKFKEYNRFLLQNALEKWDVDAVVAQAAASNDCNEVIAAALKRTVEGLHVRGVARGMTCGV